jgi:hypothetical protein
MRNIVMQVLSLGLVVLSVSAARAAPPALSAFPAAKAGMERFAPCITLCRASNLAAALRLSAFGDETPRDSAVSSYPPGPTCGAFLSLGPFVIHLFKNLFPR